MSSSIRGKRSWHNDRHRGRCVSIRLLKSLFSVSISFSLLSFTPACSTTDPTLSSPFRIVGICAETSRTRAPGKQWVCTLPSANVAQTCRTIKSPMTTASRSVSQRGTKLLRLESSKTGGGGGGGRLPRPGLLLPLLHPGSVVSRRWFEGQLGRSRPGCTGPVQRSRQSSGGGSVSSGLLTYSGLVGVSPGCFLRCSPLPQLGLLPKQLVDLSLHGLQLQLHRMQLERVLTCTQM